MPTSRGWYAVDIDGTAARYDGWKGPDHVGEPIVPVIERVKALLAAGETVKWYTARINTPSPVEYARVKRAIDAWSTRVVGQALPIVCEKDYGMIEQWDDRVKQVLANEGVFLEDAHRAAAARIEFLETRLTKLQTSPKGKLEKELDRLRTAGLALYNACHWQASPRLAGEVSMSPEKAARLWDQLRDALGLEPSARGIET